MSPDRSPTRASRGWAAYREHEPRTRPEVTPLTQPSPAAPPGLGQQGFGQPSFEDLGTPLAAVTFVVVDLETTGGGEGDTITEIGAVKVRGGEVLAEYQTLVNPATAIPPLIAVLTGITNQMVAGAPRLPEVLPSFLEFAAGSVLVAHNAGFDVGFLKRAAKLHDHPWPGFLVVDTVALARQSLLKDEVPNCKLATLAAFFRTTTQPNHRALSDARATVEVLHGLLARVGNLGVSTLEDLTEFTHRVSPQRRAKRALAQGLPDSPGVYWFWADLPDGQAGTRREVLYVGKSRSLRTRVRSYFTASEKRGRIEEMVRVADGVDHVVCSTELEAEVRELRMIAAHAPRYNRRSKRQHRTHWVKVTQEAFPRLSVVRQVTDDGARYWGPFGSSQAAQEGCLALYDAFPIRQCTTRLSARRPSPACALGEMGRCPAPCQLGEGVDQYSAVVEALTHALDADVRPVVRAVGSKLDRLARQQRFEEAQELTRRLTTYTSTTRRWHRLSSLARCSQIVAARRIETGWEVQVLRRGRLVGSAHCPIGGVPQQVARDAVSMAESVPDGPAWLPAASVEEAERVAAWMEQPGVRLIEIEGEWAWPVGIGLGEGELARVAAVGAEHLALIDPDDLATGWSDRDLGWAGVGGQPARPSVVVDDSA
ncbi:DEDD exonuclease domain-containing protein [Aestuariimicrobium kwangyangense]|uniref:DEDD exonuclease domain-containing protein n=1 Tax=Aestuariimicrobium kwangyangense TaxID=396389 RepID=UPI000A07867B|nr:DEDD exonuclease domain-containing protein [Aestuariimicrobium kwangyangense]